jgi:hypothetical protein
MGVLAIMGISLGIAALYVAPVKQPLQMGVAQVSSFFRQARLRAMATTSAYQVSGSGTTTVVSKSADSCSATTWTPDDQLTLPDGVAMTSGSWSVCFSSRGVSSDNIVLTLTHAGYRSISIEVLIGGVTRILE